MSVRAELVRLLYLVYIYRLNTSADTRVSHFTRMSNCVALTLRRWCRLDPLVFMRQFAQWMHLLYFWIPNVPLQMFWNIFFDMFLFVCLFIQFMNLVQDQLYINMLIDYNALFQGKARLNFDVVFVCIDVVMWKAWCKRMVLEVYTIN